MQPSLTQENRQSGSILIVVLGFIMVASVFLTFGVDFLKLRSPTEDKRQTLADMDILINEIASYVQKNNRLPCPASPSVLPTASGYGLETKASNPSTSCTIREGIIPARTLYLPEKFMKDSWGNYYTYAISPVYADITATTEVYQNCRVYPWSVGGNINPNKARFCCPGFSPYASSTDLRVRSISNTYDVGPRPAGGYAALNAGGASFGDAIESTALVIVSHGPNGVGAFLPNGSGAKATGTLLANEEENADGDNMFFQNLNDSSPGNYFDDIVVYKSQLQLMAHLNDGSCMRPFYSFSQDMIYTQDP